MADVDTPQSSPFLRQLASSDPETRTEALETLRVYLSGHSSFTSLELLKLWKGLYYCMWMSDKALTQQRLASELAGLIEILRRENVIPFLDAFWNTMAREWSGIDALRMDKFLRLVRFYLRATWVWLAKGEWRDAEARKRFLDILEETPLSAKDMKIPNGLRYHVLDIYVDELEKIMPEEEEKRENVPLQELLEPVTRLAKQSPTKPVRKRAQETLNDDRIKEWRGEVVEQEKEVVAQEPKDDDDFEGFD